MSISVKTIKGNRYVYVDVPSELSDDWVTRYVGPESPESTARGLRIRLQHLKKRRQHYEALIRECEAEIKSLTNRSVNSRD